MTCSVALDTLARGFQQRLLQTKTGTMLLYVRPKNTPPDLSLVQLHQKLKTNQTPLPPPPLAQWFSCFLCVFLAMLCLSLRSACEETRPFYHGLPGAQQGRRSAVGLGSRGSLGFSRMTSVPKKERWFYTLQKPCQSSDIPRKALLHTYTAQNQEIIMKTLNKSTNLLATMDHEKPMNLWKTIEKLWKNH